MSPHEQLATVMARIGVLPSVSRIRREDEIRASRQVADFDRRVEAAVARFEQIVERLEKALV